MKRFFKWTGIILGSLIGVLLIALGVLYVSATAPLRTTYDIAPASLSTAPPDSAVLARGAHVAEVRGCMGCHGADLSGEVFFDNPLLGTLAAPNLTPGDGGLGRRYASADWVRAIRHGVNPDGVPLLIMPSHEFAQLGRADLEALVAFLQQVPPVDKPSPTQSIGPLLPVVALIAKMDLTTADQIDHDAPVPYDPEPGVTPAYGRYMALGCQGCHGEDLTGRNNMGEISSNLTMLDGWTEANFVAAVREGVRPNGDSLAVGMPRWEYLTDTESQAIWAFLQTLEPAGKPTTIAARD